MKRRCSTERSKCQFRNSNLRALRFRARRVSWLPGDLACAAAAAHAADVGDECHLRHLAGRFDRDCRRALQHSQHDPRFHRRRLLDHKRSRRIRDHRSHAEDVQEEEIEIWSWVIRPYADKH